MEAEHVADGLVSVPGPCKKTMESLGTKMSEKKALGWGCGGGHYDVADTALNNKVTELVVRCWPASVLCVPVLVQGIYE